MTVSRDQGTSSHLAQYADAFSVVTERAREPRIEVTVEFTPGDELVEFAFVVPASLAESMNGDVPLARLSVPDRHGGWRAVETTERRGAQVQVERHPGATEVRLVDAPAAGDIAFSFVAWEAAGALCGPTPYVSATLNIALDFPALANVPVLVTVVSPRDVTPRSIQGSHALAYPSRTQADRRLLNVYFTWGGRCTLTLRAGPTDGLASPWVALGKAAAPALLAAFLVTFAASADRSERLLAIIAAVVALGSVVWDLLSELADFSVYLRRSRWITLLVLGGQLLVLVLLAVTAWDLSRQPDELLHVLRPASAVIAGLLAATAAAGFVLHFQGFWHGYQCDYTGCRTSFRVRRNRPECRFTGRVFCAKHVRDVCSTCVHGPDLRGATLRTLPLLGPQTTICQLPPALEGGGPAPERAA